jgi:vanillate O-demethylase ferredoxin subunit
MSATMDAGKTFKVRVSKKELLTPEIALFELSSEDGSPLPAFEAGAHVDVGTPSGKTRQYSLCGNPHQAQRYEIAVLKETAGRGGSQSMHEGVQAGDELSISAPRNQFALTLGAQRSLLLAGGIGITPLLSMAQTLSQTNQEFSLHYCARAAARAAFVDRIESSDFADKVHFHFDDGLAEQKLDMLALLALPQPGIHLYVCGPQGFMDAVLTTARKQGWPEDQLHYEFFKAEPVSTAVANSFEVVLASSGQVIRVDAGQTVIAALAANGVSVMTSCEQGVCGTCVTRVLEGEPDHLDMYFTPEEKAINDQFLPCCSRAKSSRLVLDL